MLTFREQQMGLLDVISYLAALIAVVGAVAWSWNLILLLGLILAALPYAVLCELQNLEQGQGNDVSRRPQLTIAKQGSVSQGR